MSEELPSPNPVAKPEIHKAIEEARRIFEQTDDVVSRERARRILAALEAALEALS